MDDELVELDEGAGVAAGVEPFARGLLSRLVLAANPLLAAPELGFAAAVAELLETLLKGHVLETSSPADYRESASRKSTYSLTFAPVLR